MYYSEDSNIFKCGLPAFTIATSADAINYWQREHVEKVYQGVPGFVLGCYMYRARDRLKQHMLFMCDQTRCFPLKDWEATRLSWTLFPFSHFNAIIAAGALIINATERIISSSDSLQNCARKRPKAGKVRVPLAIWLLSQHTKGRVVSFRWSCFCTEGANQSHKFTKWSCVKSFTVIKYTWKE